MYTKNFDLVEKATATVADSVGSWVISSSSFDRVNDRIMQPALKSQVGKDILCLWQHDHNQPIGRWTNVRMVGEKLAADLILAKTQVGEMIRALLDVKTPLGSSIGFKGAGKKNEKGGVDFHEISILETSVCSVPCNSEAVQIAKSFGINIQPSSEVDVPDPEVADAPALDSGIRERAVASLQLSLRSIQSNPWSTK